jgi:biopolymer transport protein ExbB/TolQ
MGGRDHTDGTDELLSQLFEELPPQDSQDAEQEISPAAPSTAEAASPAPAEPPAPPRPEKRKPASDIQPVRPSERARDERDPATDVGALPRPSPAREKKSKARPAVARARRLADPERKEKPRQDTSRLAGALTFGLPAVVVAAFLITVYFAFGRESWIYKFFLNRSPVQWCTLYAFACGLGVLLRRLSAHRRERRALADIKRRDADAESPSMAWRRFRRFRTYLVRRGFEGAQEYGRALADNDATELDAAYALVGDIIQVLPMLGFFGTVLGLALGLHGYFATAGAQMNISAFARALGTAFDTTLLGLACTIVVVSLQRPLRKREEASLAELNRHIDDYYFSIVPPPSEIQRSKEDWSEAALAKLSGELKTICRVIAEEAHRGIGAACSTATQKMRDEAAAAEKAVLAAGQSTARAAEQCVEYLKQSARETATAAREEIAAAAGVATQAFRVEVAAAAEKVLAHVAKENESFQREMAAGFRSALGEAVAKATEVDRKAQAEGMQSLLAAARESADAVRAAVGRMEEQDKKRHDSFAALAERMSEIVNRPRRITVVERPWTDEETGNGSATTK